MRRLRGRRFNAQILNAPNWNFNHLFTTRGQLLEARIVILLFLYIPYPFVVPNQDIGHLIQACPALYFIVDTWQVVGTPSVQDWTASEVTDSEASDNSLGHDGEWAWAKGG